MDRYVAGVDEAGRGCVIGPMVVAGVLLKLEALEALESSGVRDSKKLTARARERLYEVILNEASRLMCVIVDPAMIDRYVRFKKRLGGLNVLELEVMADVLRELRPREAYVDCPDRNLKKFLRRLKSKLPWEMDIKVAHKEFDDHPAVASASIVAKVLRDRIVENLRKLYGDFGSGYPSDPKTVKFLIEVYKAGYVPSYVRKSWKLSKLDENLTRSAGRY
ncbi:ribonuclease HII [Candidatus Bathyarchaeota archaeon]|nr:ribonuclease HII [Candidatus Bathyarchaeota archaeon]RJS74941.1 MAG: ribonuclease HII [Candidatus Bathyarchaeota archaeon]